jgi:hypothetical protein
MRMRRYCPVLMLLMITGCESGLVTGYQPRRLGDSPAARRAYYAGKFTPQARVAEEDKAEDLRLRRPNPGGGGPSPY